MIITRLGQRSSWQTTLPLVSWYFSVVVSPDNYQLITCVGMLATVTGLQGGAHNGLGKGFGGLLGGITIETTKSTHKAFWLFGVVCLGISVVYIAIVSIIHYKHRNDGGEKKEAIRRIKRENSDEEIEKESYEKNDEQKVVRNQEEKETFLEDGGNLSD